MSETVELASLQRWVQAVIRHPEGVEAGAASAPARREMDLAPGNLDQVVNPSAQLSSAQRLAIYSRGYHLRLLECLRTMHPALQHALGPELFDEFALDFLQARPSRSYTLGQLNADFAEHLGTQKPDIGSEDEQWPDLLIDLARLERAFMEVFDGPGTEGVKPELDPPAGNSDSGWETVTVQASPSLRLIRSGYPVGRYLQAVRAGQHPRLPFPEPSFIALSRKDYRVILTELDLRRFETLELMLHGSSIGQAARQIRAAPGEIWAWVRHWISCGFFLQVRAGRG